MCAILGFTSPSLKKEQVLPYFEKTKSRGPDDTRLEPAGSGMLGFHRLAIMGLHPEGMQPFHRGGDMAVCNGELYGFRPVKKALEAKGYVFASDSDCEIILPLWQEYGTEMFAGLDAEFAMIIYDSASDSLVAARDHSASVRCSTAVLPTARSSSPAKRRISSASARTSSRSRRDTITRTANLSAIPI